MSPAPSVARTWNVWLPSPRPDSASGDVQPLQAPPSSRHSNVEPGSSDENSNEGEASELGSLGATSMVVSGAVRSTFTVLVGSV